MNLKLTPRDRRAVLLGAAALGVLILARLVVLPWLDGWSAARAHAAADRAELLRIETQLARLVAQRHRLKDPLGSAVGKDLQDVESARVSLFASAQAALGAAGFSASDYQPQKPRRLAGLPGVQEICIQVRGKCNGEQLTNMLAQLCKTPTLVVVRQLSLDNDEKKPGELEVTMILMTLARGEVRS